MEKLSLGTIVDTFGMDGAIRIKSTTTNQKIRYQKGNKLFLVSEDISLEVTVEKYHKSGLFDIVKFSEISDIDAAKNYKGFEIQVEKNINDLEEGYYFYSDLCECALIDNKNNEVGKVIKVEEFPAQITLRCKSKNGKEFFVPFIKEFVKNVDIENKKISVELIEGML